MKIYDCFMFFDEEMLLDLRLNIMDKYVDKFVITEATYMHSGKPKKLIFDINKFSKFKDKIIYIVVDKQPTDILEIKKNDTLDEIDRKKTMNASKRELFQIGKTKDGLKDANDEDIIIVSDVDEIPNLKEINFKSIKKKLIFFKQQMFYYKLNLYYPNMPWFGSKACKKKDFISPQWLRTIKNKKYPLWRADILLSKIKYNSILYIPEGGWHFTNVREPEDLQKKLMNFLHHVDFEQSGLSLRDLRELIDQRRIMYNHSIDKKGNKWGKGKKLEKMDLNKMPNYILNNLEKYKNWLEI